MAKSLLLASLLFQTLAHADITGIWNSDGNESQIRITLDSKTETYFGTITAISDPIDNETGKPWLDKYNPDPEKRDQPILGLQLMRDFKKKSKTKYSDGKIYDPKSGKTYSGTITQSDTDTLRLRGYIGISLIGRTTIWKRAEK